MSKIRWMRCIDCKRRYCEFCFIGEKYEKANFNKTEENKEKE